MVNQQVMNLQLNFSYFDYENRRITCSLQFANPDNFPADELESILRHYMIMGQYFIPAEWIPVSGELADETILAEFESLDETNRAQSVCSVNELLRAVQGEGWATNGVRRAA
jgi:hypothetical protein